MNLIKVILPNIEKKFTVRLTSKTDFPPRRRGRKITPITPKTRGQSYPQSAQPQQKCVLSAKVEQQKLANRSGRKENERVETLD